MKKIVLLCAQAMSTGMLMNKMLDEAKKAGYECIIEAYPVAQAKIVSENADCLLIGPQVRYELEHVKTECPDVPVAVIDMVAYGRLDGKKVLSDAIKLMNA